MKNKIIKLFTLIIIVIVSISCGELITDPKDNGGGTIPPLDTNATYKVRMGSIITNIKPTDMTNAWKDYIGGKKLSTGNTWRFEKNSDY